MQIEKIAHLLDEIDKCGEDDKVFIYEGMILQEIKMLQKELKDQQQWANV